MPRKEKVGKVVSTRMEKTVVVAVDDRRPHPKYGKFHVVTTKFHAHDEAGEATEGDVVRIVESRPYSKTKRWRLEAVLQKVEQV